MACSITRIHKKNRKTADLASPDIDVIAGIHRVLKKTPEKA